MRRSPGGAVRGGAESRREGASPSALCSAGWLGRGEGGEWRALGLGGEPVIGGGGVGLEWNSLRGVGVVRRLSVVSGKSCNIHRDPGPCAVRVRFSQGDGERRDTRNAPPGPAARGARVLDPRAVHIRSYRKHREQRLPRAHPHERGAGCEEYGRRSNTRATHTPCSPSLCRLSAAASLALHLNIENAAARPHSSQGAAAAAPTIHVRHGHRDAP